MNVDVFIQLLDYAGQLPTYKTHNKQQSRLHLHEFRYVPRNTKRHQHDADMQQKVDKGFTG